MFRVAVVFILLASAAIAEPITGKARITDGDTVVIGTTTVRLEGIDAPEKKQSCTDARGKGFDCGKSASQFLADLVKGVEISCEQSGTDQNGRVLAYCFLPDGTDINGKLVAAGYAFAFVHYSDRYVPHEARAKASRAGLWRGRFSYPWCHRDAESGKPCRSADAFAEASPLPGPPNATGKAKPSNSPERRAFGLLDVPLSEFDCAPKYCKQMRSCKEARHHFSVCGDSDLDRDDDGVPCENVCPGG